jgi:hypothetical protein
MLGIDLKLNNLTSIMRTLEGIVFIDLDSTASAHYLLGTPFVAAADYSIPFYVYFVGDSIRVWGNTSNFQGRLTINGNGSINWRVSDNLADTGVDAPLGSVPVNKLSFIKVVRTGAVGDIIVNGTNVFSGGVDTDAITIEGLGIQSNSTSGGLMSRPSFIDITTPANSLYFKLNQLTKEYELPTNNVFGSELATNGDFATDSNWTKSAGATISGGQANLAGSNAFIQQSMSVSNGELVQVTYEVSGNTSDGDLFLSSTGFGDTSFGLPESVGVHIVFVPVLDAAAPFKIILTNYTTGALNLSNISVKQVTNVLTYQNIALGAPTRDTYALASAGTQWVSDLRTIDIAAQAPPLTALFNSSGVLTCSGTLSCSEIIPCGV